jgi:hypothetical protein
MALARRLFEEGMAVMSSGKRVKIQQIELLMKY